MPRRQRIAFLGSFWILLAAWVCLTLPPTTARHALLWVKGARHFSHTQDLRQKVSALLSAPIMQDRQLDVASTSERDTPPAALPASFGLKKIDSSPAGGVLRFFALRPVSEHPMVTLSPPTAPVTDVPCPPPREVCVA